MPALSKFQDFVLIFFLHFYGFNWYSSNSWKQVSDADYKMMHSLSDIENVVSLVMGPKNQKISRFWVESVLAISWF